MAHKVVATSPLLGGAPKLLQADDIELVAYDGADECAPRKWLLEHAPGAAALIVTMRDIPVNDEVLKAAGQGLRVVSTVSVGFDHLDTNAIGAAGVRIGHSALRLSIWLTGQRPMCSTMRSRISRSFWRSWQCGELARAFETCSMEDGRRGSPRHSPSASDDLSYRAAADRRSLARPSA